VLSSRVQALEYAGLEVGGIESEVFAMLRALGGALPPQGRFWRNHPHGYLLLGAHSSSLVITRLGVPVFLRTLPWGSRRFAEALAHSREWTPEAAQSLLLNSTRRLNREGILEWEETDQLHQSDALQPELRDMSREIIRLLNYFGSLHPDQSYESVLSHLTLCGGLAALPGLDTHLDHLLGLPVRASAPNLAGNFLPQKQSEEALLSAQYGIAFGLAQAALAQAIEQSSAPAREYRRLAPPTEIDDELAVHLPAL
jgi:Tfp pilus assembly PilM family ATPase